MVRRLRDRVDEQREPGGDRDRAGDVGRVSRSERLSRTSRGASRKAITPTGTLTKKIHSQPRYFVRRPPASTPTAAPEPPIAPQMPSALLRSGPSSKVVMMIESAAGEMIAAPRPCTARARDQHALRRREAAGERGEREDDDADEEHAPPPEQVGRAPAEQEEAAEGDRVRRHDPLEVLAREVERRADRWAARR